MLPQRLFTHCGEKAGAAGLTDAEIQPLVSRHADSLLSSTSPRDQQSLLQFQAD